MRRSCWFKNTQWWEYEGTSRPSIVCLCVQWYYAVCLNMLEQESDLRCLVSSLIRSVSSSSTRTFRLISSSFSILAFCLWTSFSSASFWSNQWSLFIMLMFTALNCSHLQQSAMTAILFVCALSKSWQPVLRILSICEVFKVRLSHIKSALGDI